MADDAPPHAELLAHQMASRCHTILIRPYAGGQIRIQLTRRDWPDAGAPPGHGQIVRELCTYQVATALRTVLQMRVVDDPEAYCESLARPWNCEYERGRIRLDNTPADRPFHCPHCGAVSHHPRDATEGYCVRCHRFADPTRP